MPTAAILDVDGTLVDTNYQHAIAWFRAFRQHGIVLPIWRIHRHIGMGGDQLVAALTSDEVEEQKGEDIRAAEKTLYLQLIEEVQPLTGARELIEDLRRAGRRVVLASSAKPDEVDHYLELLDARGIVDDWTTSGDVESTKPEPDLVRAAIEKAGERGRRHGGRLHLGLHRREERGDRDGGRPDWRVLGAGAARRRGRVRLRVDRGAPRQALGDAAAMSSGRGGGRRYG